ISSFMDAVWWSIVTVTTVGYGDLVPHSFAGRIYAIFLILFGMVLFSLLTGLIASFLVEEKLKGDKGLKQIKLNRHIIICGWNATSENILQSISEQKDFNPPIIIVGTFNSEVFREIQSKFPEMNLKFVRGDYTQEVILDRANVRQASQIVILANRNVSIESADDKTVIAATAVRFLSQDVPITVQLLNKTNKSHLQQMKINNIISNDEMGALLIVNNIFDSNFLSFHSSFLKNINLMKTKKIPENFTGNNFAEVVSYFYDELGMIVLGVINKKKELQMEDIFSDDDSAIDLFIKNKLEELGKNVISRNDKFMINPPKDYVIVENDLAIVMD
ncbi:MAG: ion channel, partial [Candidatus Cloacimonadota bacterium]|nr:ion channel [Candidatus Cloacimonadota bacterium]